MRRYLTSTELARRWGYSRKTIVCWCRSGCLKGAEKFGSQWRIPIELIAGAEHVPPRTLAAEYGTESVDMRASL